MSEAFDWSRVLKTDADPAKAAAKEGLAINPVTGEPILDKKTPLEVVPGGASDALGEKTADAEADKAPDKASEKTSDKSGKTSDKAAEKNAEKSEEKAPAKAKANPDPEPELPTRTVDVLDKTPPKTLEEIQAEYANKDLFAPKSASEQAPENQAVESKSAEKTVYDISAPTTPGDEPAAASSEGTESVEPKLAEPLDGKPELKLETSEDQESEATVIEEANAPEAKQDRDDESDEGPAIESKTFFDLKPKSEEDAEAEAQAKLKADLFAPTTPEPMAAMEEAAEADESEQEYKEDALNNAMENPNYELFAVSEPESKEKDVFANGEATHPDMSKHYRPAELPENIYDIPLSTNKFDVGSEIASLSDEVEILEDVTAIQDVHLDDILRCAIERKASDIHFTVGLPPMARIDGEVAPLPFSIAEAADTRRIVYDVLTDEQVQKFEQTHELDFGYGVSGLGRFRFNVYMQRGSVAGALRAIPTKIPSFEDLGLPPVIRDISKRSSGLVLVTGPTGSGKSTTIASMIDDINNQRTSHIITIEDPIEYLHPHKKCMVNQRELHGDTYSFHNALRAVLREDPDIILVGELRDLETIEAALTLAETGHLVFGTLHTRNAPSTIDRVIDVFPSDQQDQIRVLLGNTLEGVVSQQLLPRLGGGRCAAIEIMIGTPAIKNLIREGKTHQMYSVLETSSNIGMQTMDASLSTLFRNGYCSYDECLMRAVDKETFARLAKGG